MAEDKKVLRFNLMKDHYENHGKSANYLLAAHGAGLVGCLSLLKDYANTPQLKGVGAFIVLFGVGLLGSIAAYVSIAISRAIALNLVVYGSETDEANRPIANFLLKLNIGGLIVAVLTLFTAIVLLIYRFASL
jgi:hypothetical protein